MPAKRENRFNVMFSDEEMEMLRALADNNATTIAEYLRQTVRKNHRAQAEALARLNALPQRGADHAARPSGGGRRLRQRDGGPVSELSQRFEDAQATLRDLEARLSKDST